MKDYGKTLKFTSEDLIKATGSDFIAEVNEFFGHAGKKEVQDFKDRIAKLEREVQGYKEENVRLLQQCLALYRAVKKANCNLDAVEEKCEANVWFQRLKERTY